jgi:2-iminobutanoate/2-iminopropanoate deaminase
VSAGTIERITSDQVGRLPAFSHATRAGGFIHVSGTLGTKPGTFTLVEGGMAEQTRQTLENIRAILRAAGADLQDVVKVQVFVTDMARFPDMNQVYREFFPSEPPARITVGCSALALGGLVEIDCVAYRP